MMSEPAKLEPGWFWNRKPVHVVAWKADGYALIRLGDGTRIVVPVLALSR